MIKGKISKGLGILTKLRHYLPNRILVNLHYMFIHPYYDYCNIIWATGTSTYLNILFLLPKRAMHLITNSPWHAHTAPLFNRLRVLTIFEIADCLFYV